MCSNKEKNTWEFEIGKTYEITISIPLKIEIIYLLD